MWLKQLTLHLCPKLNFPSRRQFSQETLPRLVEKTIYIYIYIFFLHWQNVILQQLALICGCPKELNYDVFALVINFLGKDW